MTPRESGALRRARVVGFRDPNAGRPQRRTSAFSRVRRGFAAVVMATLVVAGASAWVRASGNLDLQASASSRETVTALDVRPGPDAAPRDLFAPGTKAVWVTLSYTGMVKSSLDVAVSAPNGVEVFRREAEVSGDGNEAWEVTGSAIAGRLSATLISAAQAAGTNARLAVDQQRGVTEYLAVVTYAVSQLTAATDLLDRVSLEPAAESSLRDVADAAETLQGLVGEANRLPANDDEGRRLYARRMIQPAADAATAAETLAGQLEGAEGVGIAPTRAASGENAGYTVTAHVDGRPARTSSFWVFALRAFLPRAFAP